MQPIEFAEATVRIAENQDEYMTLPAWQDGEVTLSCWRLTWRERFAILFRGVLWVHLMNFGQPLQPVAMSTTNPFSHEVDNDGTR